MGQKSGFSKAWEKEEFKMLSIPKSFGQVCTEHLGFGLHSSSLHCSASALAVSQSAALH
jgi:hypothetical protein